jgi:hypothetical protein
MKLRRRIAQFKERLPPIVGALQGNSYRADSSMCLGQAPQAAS